MEVQSGYRDNVNVLGLWMRFQRNIFFPESPFSGKAGRKKAAGAPTPTAKLNNFNTP